MNGIAGFFLVVAFIVLACAATSVLSIALVFRRLNHANRVSPSVPTPAPLSWLWSFRTAARMHRRLRAGIATARAAVAVQGAVGLGLDDVVAELEARACQLDAQLVVADRAPQRPRLRMLRELAA
ncbi:MAG TPA: hypothetical protein VHN98_04935, partial [Acidimicrobiales bacterium]|nr:hypothetical protein [Acidimicrobiales bacterium]